MNVLTAQPDRSLVRIYKPDTRLNKVVFPRHWDRSRRGFRRSQAKGSRLKRRECRRNVWTQRRPRAPSLARRPGAGRRGEAGPHKSFACSWPPPLQAGAPAPADRRPDADEAARREQHEAYEYKSEPEQPVLRPDRKQLAEQDKEQRAERRPEDVMHAADHNHGEEFAGERHRDRFSRHQVGLEAEQGAGNAGHDSGQHEDRQLVAIDRVALERGAQLVLADRHQHMSERRAHHPQQR